MKKIKLLIIPVLILALSLNVMASGSTSNGIFEFVFEDKVVVFDESSTLTEAEMCEIAERLVYGVPEDNGASTYSWCWLTGHDYTYDMVSVITHKYRAPSPRCYQETYKIETCTKCDHFQEEYLGAVYIVCCPEE